MSLLTLLACGTFVLILTCSSGGARAAVMATYPVSNSEQCRRLCWYHKSCVTYVYQGGSAEKPQCQILDSETASNDWEVKTAEKGPITNICVTRPCADTEVCVPVGSASHQKHCLPIPAATSGVRATAMSTPAASTASAPAECQNGGYFNGTACVCDIQFSGDACERYIRDCTEAVERNQATSAQNDFFFVHPEKAPFPFMVLCDFGWGGVTRVLMVSSYSSIDFYGMKWTTAKTGFGNKSPDFFIGLEQLHLLTKQADYVLHASLWNNELGSTGCFYRKFKVGPESSNYSISYETVQPRHNTTGDVFDVSPPITFHTRDMDTNGCVASVGYPGWYGSDCNGFAFDNNIKLKWPMTDGTQIDLENVSLILERHS